LVWCAEAGGARPILAGKDKVRSGATGQARRGLVRQAAVCLGRCGVFWRVLTGCEGSVNHMADPSFPHHYVMAFFFAIEGSTYDSRVDTPGI